MARFFWSFAAAVVLTTMITMSVLVYIGAMAIAVLMMGEAGHFVALVLLMFVIIWTICYFDF